MTTIEKISLLIADKIEVRADEINEETAIGDFPKWDSLAHLMIISAIEEKFDIKFDPETLMDLEDVGDIIDAVNERLNL